MPMASVEPGLFRDAMSQLGAAVNLITSDGVAGRHGMTASAVCSVTDSPPMLLLCINRASQGNAVFRANGRLCVNILASGQEAFSQRFADKALPVDERFGDPNDWFAMPSGVPALKDTVACLDCRIENIVEKYTHSIFFGVVEALTRTTKAHGLIYFDRRYHPVGK